MADKQFEPAAFIFPLPDNLKEHYLNWTNGIQQFPGSSAHESGEPGYTPVFIPVYPAYPGMMPYPGSPAGAGQCGDGGMSKFPGFNPFILFLILVLLVIIFKKDQIVSVIKKLIMKEQTSPSNTSQNRR